MKRRQLQAFAERMRSLPANKRVILERELKAKGVALTDFEISRRPGPRDEFPLSFSQERLWFLHQMDSSNVAYHVAGSFLWPGILDAPILERALNEVVRRHEVLRTHFAERDGEARQVVRRSRPLSVPVVDLSRLSSAQRRGEARRIGHRSVDRPFDLARDPLVRLTVVRLAEDENALFLCMHHIVSDAWSLAVLASELRELYLAFQERRPSPLPDLPIQYGDVADWQRQWLAGEFLADELAYWRERLRGAPRILELPADRPRPPVQTFRGARVGMDLPRPLAGELKSLGRAGGASLFMALVAVFKILLSRTSGQRDLSVGIPIAGRHRAETERLIGFFVNTLVLRTELTDKMEFRALLDQVRRRVLEADAYQDLPFEKLVAELQPERSLSYPPLFQVMIAMENVALDVSSRGGAEKHDDPFGQGTQAAKFDLTLEMEEVAGRVHGSVFYNTDLFDDTTIRRLTGRFETLVQAVVDDPERPISRVPMLHSRERHQMLTEWNAAVTWARPRDAWQDGLLHRIFEGRAESVPESTAVVCGDAALSYRQLDRRAGELAQRLTELGVRPEARVAVCLERGLGQVVAIVGILKAGGAYVPLDPHYPRERLRFLLADSRCDVLVARRGTAVKELEDLAEDRSCPILWLEPEAETSTVGAIPEAGVVQDAATVAYVIYTSGSTGEPKGVQVSHRNVARLFEATRESFSFGRDDVWALFHSFAFDFSVWELWGALLFGGRLVVVSRDASRSPEAFYRLLVAERVTVLNQTPAAFQQLTQVHAATESTLALDWVIFGGDALEVAGLRPWLAPGTGGPRLVNMYGITETTVHVTERRLRTADLELAGASPIGRPIRDLEIRLLDRSFEPVPMGSAGEILVGGAGVARGYLFRPGLTAERFVPDPFGARPGDRLYRSGDLARYLADGDLVYQGRIDHQVKIRGFRVELGEIEATLNAHPKVRDVAVIYQPASTDGGRPARLLAHVVPEGDMLPASRELRGFAARRLPDYMVPALFVVLDVLPVTAHGKIDRGALAQAAQNRRALPKQRAGDPPSDASRRPPSGDFEDRIAAVWKEVLDLEHVGTQDNFFDLGGHSLLLLKVRDKVRKALDRELEITDLFRYPTIAALAESLRQAPGGTAPNVIEGTRRAEMRRAATGRPSAAGAALEVSETPSSRDVAIIGMALRFPGAKDLDGFWRNLQDGVEAISFFTDEDLEAAGIDRSALDDPAFVGAYGLLEGAEEFDARLFGMSPREAELIDPQQRLFLECAWEALENAGYDPATFEGAIGVYGGAGASRYWQRVGGSERSRDAGPLEILVGNDKDFLPTRTSYKLDLRGPSVNVQTACSTSLVATHLACQALAGRECDLALAGGSAVKQFRPSGYRYREGDLFSPDGHCRAFDARAAGTVGGDGAGLVVLKRLSDALADGDHVYAVVKGSALNNDGSAKIGFTAPSVERQAAVIAEALAVAGVSPETLGYVEAHGTATPLGDPIEVAALKEVLGTETAKRCALGSVKTNLGHLDVAAGAAGLIKTVLALQHREIPPSLHFEEPNPEIDLEHSPLYVNTRLSAWPDHGAPRRAGVSSFGIGGTNAHVVLEEAPAAAPSGPTRPWQLLVLSAASETSLEAATDRLASHLREHPEESFADVAFTLRVGRRRLTHRRTLVCRDLEDARAVLEARDPERLASSVEERQNRGVTFMFPGLGDHYSGMAEELYRTEPVFRAEVDRCAEILKPRLGRDLREVLYPAGGESPAPEEGRPAVDFRRLAGRTAGQQSSGVLGETHLAQPAVFVVEYALAKLWTSWGLRPEAFIGYSLGEYVAACLAGVFPLADGLALVADRAELISELPAGAMAAVPLAADALRPYLSGDVALAATNTPEVSVAAGPVEAVADLERALAEADVVCQRLKTSHAFHSPMMEAIAERFAERMWQVSLEPPRIPYMSNVTGTWIDRRQATDPDYWVRHLIRTVRFAEGVGELLESADRILLEVGPGQALSTSVRQHPRRSSDHLVLSSLRDERVRQSDSALALQTLGRLWLAGAAVDWRAFSKGETRRRVPLPTYAFERRRYFLEAAPADRSVPRLSGKAPDVADWFYLPSWTLSQPPRAAGSSPVAESRSCWLLLGDGEGLGAGLAGRLAALGQDVVRVRFGARLDLSGDPLTIDPERREDYLALLESLRDQDRCPRHFVHCASLTPGSVDAHRPSPEARRAILGAGLYSFLFLAGAAVRCGGGDMLRFTIVSNHLQTVGEEDLPLPEKAALLGASKVLPQEYRNVLCRVIDIGPEDPPGQAVCDRVLAELIHPGEGAAEPEVAYRGARRWVRSFAPIRLRPSADSPPVLRPRGVYLITGGFGQLGKILSGYLAEAVRARLILVGRSACEEPETWDEWLANHPEDDPRSLDIRHARALEAAGAEVLGVAADVADPRQMSSAVRAARERFGEIHGVIHLAAATSDADQLHVPIEEAGPESCDAHLRPKADGLYVLRDVLEGEKLDFCILFSSLASVLGGLGFAAYASANAFMDAFAKRQSRLGDMPWTSVNWDVWRLWSGSRQPARGPGAALAAFAMAPEEGAEALARILSMSSEPQIVVSTGDLQPRLDQWLYFTDDDAASEGGEELHARPVLQTSFVPPSTQDEKALAELWREFLGLDSVGIHDNFFELGGDSLMGVRLVSRLRHELQRDLPVGILFEAPTVAQLATAVGADREAPEGGGGAVSERPAELPSHRILPREVARESYPLSFAQERQWFLHQLEPRSSAYHIPFSLGIRGPLEVPALSSALNAIVQRHEVLRTVFPDLDGEPVQVIDPFARTELPEVDLERLSRNSRDGQLRKLSRAAVRRPFDLAEGPLLRTVLLRREGDRHLFVVVMHHAISDGWSLGIFFRELVTLYEAARRGRPSPLDPLPVQYADFALWQRRWLQGGILANLLSYWNAQLEAIPPDLGLPFDRPRPRLQAYRGGGFLLRWPPDLAAALKRLARRERSTLFVTLLTAFKVLLCRSAGQDDVVVGSPIAGRVRREVEGLVGFFVNTIVLRSDLSGNPSFRELLRRVQEKSVGANAHQDLPFEKLVDELQPERRLDRMPLFQVSFALQTEPGGDIEVDGLELERQPVVNPAAQFDLSLSFSESPEGLFGELVYDADLFDRSTIGRMARQLETLIAGALEEPGRPIRALPMLMASERQALFVEWNDTARDHPGDDRTLHELVADCAAERPDAVALDDGQRCLTYRELAARSNRLARCLQASGVASRGSEARVAMLCERSLEMVLGILAVLKAGAAYVPLDPSLPRERLEFMIEDCNPAVVLVQAPLRGALGETRARVLCLDLGSGADGGHAIRETPGDSPATGISGRSAAYVIYTSGTTGRPKGVVNSHRAILNRLLWMQARHPLDPNDRLLQKTPYTFDASLWELFLPLFTGARLVLAAPEEHRDAAALLRAIQKRQITVLQLVPSMLEVLIAEDGIERSRSLRRLFCGGEAFPAKLADRARSLLEASVHNLYGPTEASIDVTSWSGGGIADSKILPIGRPISNTRVQVLDAHLHPVPTAAAGELCVDGRGLARGYLRRPVLTAEKFIPDGLGEVPGARLYRTGDLVRRLRDGTLVFLGRIDQQVKLRGYRIELGEIQAALGRHPQVLQSAAVVREDHASETRLVAYFVSGVEDGPGGAELRAFLGKTLPEYMVPAGFVRLESLPTLPNGKLDRGALSRAATEQDLFADAATLEDASASSLEEEILASIWCDVLGLEQVGVHDNFFALGGHSLLATRALSRSRKAFGVELPLSALFERPTVAGLGRAVREARREGAIAEPPILPVSRDDDLPLSFAQQRLWFLDRLEPGSAAYNITPAIELSGPLDVRALERAVAEVVRRHEALRTTIRAADGVPVQIIAPAVDRPLPLTDLSSLPEDRWEGRAKEIATAEARRPFDLAAGPLFRAILLRRRHDLHVLVVNMHHIISDGWSSGILVGELTVLYGAFSEGRPSPLAELPIQYADFACWQRAWLEMGELERQLAYWRACLAGAPPALGFAGDRPRPAKQTFRGARVPLALCEARTAELEDISRSRSVTIFMTLLAAWAAVLARHTGGDEVVVGSPIANRQREEIEGLIGFFANTLALRTDLSANPSFVALLERVRRTTLAAYSHQDLPFEKLVEELEPERDPSRHPIFQVMLTVQTRESPSGETAGLTLTGWPLEAGTAKFDLSLTLADRPHGLRGSLEYNTDLFDRSTIGRLVRHFETFLSGALAKPESPIRALPIFSRSERQALFLEWNHAGQIFPGEDLCLHHLFARRAAEQPDAAALVCGDVVLSYRELDRRADHLAGELVTSGVGPDVRVAVCLERSPDLVVAIIGILKAGGAYVPLDPTYPRRRLRLLLEDSRVSVLVSREALTPAQIGDLAEGAVPAVLEMDSTRASASETATGETLRAVPRKQHPESLAYVIYTSGSTGKPKGVQVSHWNVLRLFRATRESYSFGREDVWTLFHSYAFDFSVWELWGALLFGGKLIVVSRDVSRSPAAFYTLLAEERVTVLNQTPSSFQQLTQPHTADAKSLALDWVIFGGEALDFTGLSPWLSPAGEGASSGRSGPRLVNMYGITETTVHVTERTVRSVDLVRSGVSPIGRPIRDLQIRLLDRFLEPVPIGASGELVVGGEGVVRGYLRRPGLTAERFVPDPYGDRPGRRLYKSGDSARYRGDGDLIYQGRIDHQVKIRGFRIELGEIEAALERHPRVSQAAVLVREERAGDRRLFAYFASEDEPGPEIVELRASLRDELPEYMVPSAFVKLEVLPTLPNGKLDRGALSRADPEWNSLVDAPARNLGEEIVAGIWCDVLGLTQVGVHDSFFDLGGHSLLATQVLSRVRQAFAIELPLSLLFERPTVSDLAEAIAAARRDPATSAPPILPMPRGADLPPSFAQQRLWFLQQLEPASSAYNLPMALRFTGRLAVAALECSLGGLMARHESLRTVFLYVDGEPVQRILPARSFVLPVVDLSGLPARVGEAEAFRLNAREARRPFDLITGPLLRATLLRLTADDHVGFLTLHHVASDDWSTGILVRELVAFYEACALRRPPPLPPLPIQYADYAVWQRRWLRGENLRAELDYWRRKLGTGSPVLELPTDRPRPPVQTSRGGRRDFVLSDELSAGIRSLSRRQASTPFMTLLAVFVAQLGRLSGERDLRVGTPTAGRRYVETEGLIGFFVNTLVLRMSLVGDPTFEELLARVREVAIEAHDHQEVPFERLVEDLEPERSLARSPLFQVLFVLQNAPREELTLPELELRPFASAEIGAKFDLTLMFFDTEPLAAFLEYSADLFDGTTAARLAQHFERLARAAVEDPRRPLSRLSMLSAAERAQLLVEWNDSRVEHPQDRRTQELFSEQARATPDAIAVTFRGRAVSYRRLDASSNRLAHVLVARGVGPETIVALFDERGLDLLTAILGVFKAGAAYLPLDPYHPPRRLRQVLEQSGAPLVLSGAARPLALVQAIESMPPAARPDLEQIGRLMRDQSSDDELPRRSWAANLSYVIFTSGSTGLPKGAMVTHQGMLNHLFAKIRDLGLTPADSLAQTASQCFDISVWQFLAPLLVGGQVRVYEDGVAHSPRRLLEILESERLSIFETVPSMLSAILQERSLAGVRLAALRFMVLTGEALPPELCRRWLGLFPGIPVVNAYGPTECSDDVTHEFLHTAADTEELNVAIGRPVDNTRLYVLDPDLEPLPTGVVGELYAGGTGVGRGYLGEPRRTAAVFLPDRFSTEAGGRLYKTGDRVRVLRDGRLDFLGRVDFQVKIRGFRIELGEIEVYLRRHPRVREAAVAVYGEAGDRRLLGYVVPTSEEPPVHEIRDFLRDKLPEYMVPSVIVFRERLPLTPNGKVDRQALVRGASSAVEDARSGLEEAYVAPRNPIEEVLALTWGELLDVEQPGIHDDFFDLGGHSILAMRLAARLEDIFRFEVALRHLFQATTIAALAEVLVKYEPARGQVDKIARALLKIKAMSTEEKAARLATA